MRGFVAHVCACVLPALPTSASAQQDGATGAEAKSQTRADARQSTGEAEPRWTRADEEREQDLRKVRNATISLGGALLAGGATMTTLAALGFAKRNKCTMSNCDSAYGTPVLGTEPLSITTAVGVGMMGAGIWVLAQLPSQNRELRKLSKRRERFEDHRRKHWWLKRYSFHLEVGKRTFLLQTSVRL